MRKILAMLLACGMMCGMLAGCGGNGGGSDAPATDGGNAAADAGDSGGSENMTLIMSQRDEFLSELESAAVNAAKELGVNLTTQDANSDTSRDRKSVV